MAASVAVIHTGEKAQRGEPVPIIMLCKEEKAKLFTISPPVKSFFGNFLVKNQVFGNEIYTHWRCPYKGSNMG